jgi:uncharacterized cysteine cluster protein YcgN (CxxCxxCC family)
MKLEAACMMRKKEPFWKTKTLEQMTAEEWECLCDHCGLCCLQKVEDEDTGEIKVVGLSCEYLDIEACRCLVYEDRQRVNPDCILLTADTIKHKKWLPETCAYRRLLEGRQLERWHHLVCGDSDNVHREGISVRHKAVSGLYIHPKDLEASLKELKDDDFEWS